MKKILCLFLSVLLFVLPAFALVKQVTTVSASASTVFTAGQNCLWVLIQNNGSGNVRLAFDGSSPTASTGYLLTAGAQVTIGYGGSNQRPVIRAILTSGTTTTLDILTSDSGSY